MACCNWFTSNYINPLVMAKKIKNDAIIVDNPLTDEDVKKEDLEFFYKEPLRREAVYDGGVIIGYRLLIFGL